VSETMFLTNAEAEVIHAQVAGVVAHTGVQVVTAIVGKSDTYNELPWKAFALGASAAAFGLVVADAWRPDWVTSASVLLQSVTILSVAGASALLAIFVPPFGRLFLRTTRRELEVRHHAESLFLKRQLFRTQERNAVLLLVSLFERRIEILPDIGLHERVREADWNSVIKRMTPLLRQARPFHALQEGLTAIETLLEAKGFRASAPGGSQNDVVPDRPIEERA